MDFSYCPFCGCEIDAGDLYCKNCSREFPKKNIQLKVPAVALILSAFFPGLGQVYNGDKLIKGLVIFFAFTFGSLLWFIPGIIVWIFGMYDACKRAESIQKGEVEYIPAKNRDIFLMIIIPLIVMMILLAITIYSVFAIYGSPQQMLYEMMYYSESLAI